jgi:hypothetical protein
MKGLETTNHEELTIVLLDARTFVSGDGDELSCSLQ